MAPSPFNLTAPTRQSSWTQQAQLSLMAQLFSCLDEAAHLAWSPDSAHLLCVLQHRAVVQVFSVLHPEWTAKIDEGVAGTASPWLPEMLPCTCFVLEKALSCLQIGMRQLDVW